MSVDIKATYGAVGDGQLQNLTVSFTSGAATLTVFSNTFSAGDVNKKIAVQDWVLADGGNPAGALLCTINAVGSFSGGQQTLTLSANAQQSATSAVKQVEWGTDDTAAFSAFKTAQAGLSGVVLTIPAGRYCFAHTGGAFPIGSKIKGLTVNGSGNPVLTDMLGSANGFFLGSSLAPIFNDNQAESLTQTVAAGTTVIPFKTVANAAKYTANTWAWMTGFDTQGFGSPPNFYWAEYVFITAVDTVGGSVTIQTPLKNSYKSTWPKWAFGTVGSGAPTYTGGQFSLGGPATLYLLNQDWDATHVYNNLGIRATNTLVNMNGRDMTMNGCTFESFSVNVSQQQNCTINNCGTIGAQWELDKGTENFTLTNTTVQGFNIFSASPFNVTLDTVTILSQAGASTKRWTATNCTFPTGAAFGPSSYAGPEFVSISNSSFAGQLAPGGVTEVDITGAGGYSISGGLITRLKAGGTGATPQWAVPGHYCFIGSIYSYENTVFRVLDIWDDGTTLFIQTDLNGFPSPVFPGTTIAIITAPPPDFTLTNCTGCDDALSWSAVTANKPMFSQWKRTYSGNIGARNAAHQIKVSGKAVSIKFTVGAGYSAGTLNLDGPFVVTKPGNVRTVWNPVVDLTVAGVRTITPSGVTGTSGSDSGLALPNSGSVWLVSNQITAAMSGAVGAGTVTLEILTDQGFPSSFRNLRGDF